jgi:hypothetical protein
MPPIVFLIPYFGPWPVWINHWVESCRANPTIDWILFNDTEPPENVADNVKHIAMTFSDYCSLVSERLSIRFAPTDRYKLCDIKPALGFIHADLVRGYDFVGFGDLDVIYGNLRAFFDEETLSLYDVLSTHADRISGHLCLLRNRLDVVTAFKQARNWRRAMEGDAHATFDERDFYRVFRPARRDLLARWKGSPGRALFREAYSTPGAAERMAWFWENGRLTNEFYPQHPHMYLHFMSWHSNRWFGSQPHVKPGATAPWKRLERVVSADWRRARQHGFMISPDGITEISRAWYG